MREFYKQNKDLILKILTLIAFTLGFFIFFGYIFTYIAPMVLGYFISVLIRPLLYLFTQRLKLNRSLAIILSIGILLAFLVLIAATAINRLITEAMEFYDNIPFLAEQAEFILYELLIFSESFFRIVPQTLQENFYGFGDMLIGGLAGAWGYNLSNLGALFIIVPHIILGFVIGLISAFFFARDKELIKQSLNKLFTVNQRRKFLKMRLKLMKALGGYFKAQLIIISCVAVISSLGLLVIGIPYPFFLGITVAFVDAVPVMGSGLFYWPLIAAYAVMGEFSTALALTAVHLVCLFTRQSLEPKILSKHIGVHPIITLSAVYVGLRIFGIPGILLGPFFAVIFKFILEGSSDEKRKHKN